MKYVKRAETPEQPTPTANAGLPAFFMPTLPDGGLAALLTIAKSVKPTNPLHGVHFCTAGGKVYAVATDTFRLCEIECETPEIPAEKWFCTVPPKILKPALLKCHGNRTGVSFEKINPRETWDAQFPAWRVVLDDIWRKREYDAVRTETDKKGNPIVKFLKPLPFGLNTQYLHDAACAFGDMPIVWRNTDLAICGDAPGMRYILQGTTGKK